MISFVIFDTVSSKKQIECGTVLLSTTIRVITVVKMLWTHEVESTIQFDYVKLPVSNGSWSDFSVTEDHRDPSLQCFSLLFVVSRKLRPQTSDPENSDPSEKKLNSSRLFSPELLYRHAVFKGNSPTSKWDVQLLRLIAVASIKQWKSNIHFVWFIAVALGKQWKTKARFKRAADWHCFSFPQISFWPENSDLENSDLENSDPEISDPVNSDLENSDLENSHPENSDPQDLKKRFKLVSVLITLMVLCS